ncbi:Ig-like domain-containing protein [Streptomyces pilosus]|uniref:Ig-like domain-containing protein n=1 Tax=Streptomyces pilosus TaxID=28893 RepID=UPI0036F4EB54
MASGGTVDGCAGCFALVVIGAVVFAACGLNDGDAESAGSNEPTTVATASATATAQAVEPDWRLRDGLPRDDYIVSVRVGEPEEIELLSLVDAEDINETTYFTDALINEDGLSAADLEIKLLSKPKYGTAELDKDGIVTYTTWTEFAGLDKFRYSIKLKGKPEVLKGERLIQSFDFRYRG